MRHSWDVDGIEYAKLGVCAHGRSEMLLVVSQSIKFGIGAYIFLGAEGGGIITVAFGLLHLKL